MSRRPIWSKLPFLAVLLPARDGRAEVARRWVRARRDNPELMADVLRLGNVLTAEPRLMRDGIPEPEPIDPLRQAYEKGWRDFALHLSALMGLNHHELNSLMETNDVHAPHDDDD